MLSLKKKQEMLAKGGMKGKEKSQKSIHEDENLVGGSKKYIEFI